MAKYTMKLTLIDDTNGLIVMTGFFIFLTTLGVVLRFYSRHLQRTYFGIDDWLAVVSLIFVTALNGCFIAGCVQGAITGHSEIVNGMPVTSELEHLVQKYKYGFQSVEKLAFGFIKLSILFLWMRLFARATRGFMIFCWVMIGITIIWSLSFFFGTIFQCGTNWEWNWSPIFFFLTQCTDTLAMLTVFTATDLLTDFIIMLMPVPLIWKLNMPTRKKVSVTGIFLVGLFTAGAGIARMYIYLVTSYDKETNPDFIGDFTLFILWSEIEVNVALMVCCMPALGPVLERTRSYLRRTPVGKWIPLSAATKESKKQSRDTELSTVGGGGGTGKDAARQQAWPLEDSPWQGSDTSTTRVIDSDGEFREGRGIMTRTEILRTQEERSNNRNKAWYEPSPA